MKWYSVCSFVSGLLFGIMFVRFTGVDSFLFTVKLIFHYFNILLTVT